LIEEFFRDQVAVDQVSADQMIKLSLIKLLKEFSTAILQCDIDQVAVYRAYVGKDLRKCR
jgi:hypothetical protein